MKTIYVFNDSRITEQQPTFVALAEDGTPISRVHFTEATAPFFAYAMALLQDCPAIADESVLRGVRSTRRDNLLAFDVLFGVNQWRTEFLSEPREHEGFRAALRASFEFQQRLRERKESAVRTFDAVLSLVLAEAAGDARPTTH